MPSLSGLMLRLLKFVTENVYTIKRTSFIEENKIIPFPTTVSINFKFIRQQRRKKEKKKKERNLNAHCIIYTDYNT